MSIESDWCDLVDRQVATIARLQSQLDEQRKRAEGLLSEKLSAETALAAMQVDRDEWREATVDANLRFEIAEKALRARP